MCWRERERGRERERESARESEREREREGGRVIRTSSGMKDMLSSQSLCILDFSAGCALIGEVGIVVDGRVILLFCVKERVCFIFGTLGRVVIFENGLKKELKYRKEIVVCVFFSACTEITRRISVPYS